MRQAPGITRQISMAVLVATTLLLVGTTDAAAADHQGVKPWQQQYAGDEATGENVIALWQFSPGEEGKDNSSHGHDLQLRGEGCFVETGKFGSCLESFVAGVDHDIAQGAYARNHEDLNPPGAFTLEAWFNPKPELDQCDNAFLLDKKYYHYAKDLPQANQGYCLYLRKTGENRRKMLAYLGFGEDSVAYDSREFPAEPGQWQHAAFTYDGAGTGRFFLNGEAIGRATHEGRGGITPSTYDLAIGDRYGSTHTGFPGYIDQVRIAKGCVPYFAGVLEVAVAGARTVFVRMEQDQHIALNVINDTNEALTDATAKISFGGFEREVSVPDLPSLASHTVEVPVDATVRPDTYTLQATVTATGPDKTHEAEGAFDIVIVPRDTPHKMPVVMWGYGDFETLKQIGFTHQLISLADYGTIWTSGEPTEEAVSARLDQQSESLNEHLKQGVGAVVYLYPGRWVVTNDNLKDTFNRVNRSGTPYEDRNACASLPEVQEFAYNVGASIAKTYGQFPGLQASLIHSEIRDHTSLCFHEHDRQAFREFAGYDIPDALTGAGGLHHSRIEGFPMNRIVPDDDPVLTFYKWFWKAGDGWNPLHTQVHKGLKSTGRDDLWTFFDPAVRVPSIWGSGGDVDFISQWTYSYPDPIKMGQATDEVMAMGEGGPPHQQAMKMTQVIWYRSQTAPEVPEDESQRASWEKEIPDARFITIAPDHMREAFWSKVARPIRGIMYHGWASLVEGSHGAYRFTNPQTSEVLTELVTDVVRPLGPTLLQVPDRKTDVALLESFASQIFASRGSRGWSGSWEADMHLILQWARLQPRIIYDETVLRDGLDDYNVLVMPCCDVLTESVKDRIAAFQRRGGLIVADEHLTPALSPDILIPSRSRTKKADEDKAALQALASQLRAELDPFYERYGDSSDPDVVVRFRQYGDTDYLFAINDKRTFGTYVGHHGLVMEKGLPNAATLTVNRDEGHVYDLVAHQAVPATQTPEGLVIERGFGPGDGHLLMITSKPVTGIMVGGCAQAKRGDQVRLQVAVTGEAGEPLAAVIPVRVEILDPQDRPAEYSGYYGARDGRLSIDLDLAPNDLTGDWTIRATELASGWTSEYSLTVN
jgi:Concanavalin A-like lectin/glucanases superfamily